MHMRSASALTIRSQVTSSFFTAVSGNYHLALLDDRDNIPFNLYPFVHLLPSGNLFIFAGQKSVVLDYKNNRVVKNLPDLGPGDVRRNYPVTGTSALLPLTPGRWSRTHIRRAHSLLDQSMSWSVIMHQPAPCAVCCLTS